MNGTSRSPGPRSQSVSGARVGIFLEEAYHWEEASLQVPFKVPFDALWGLHQVRTWQAIQVVAI